MVNNIIRFRVGVLATSVLALLTMTACEQVATDCPPVPLPNVVTVPEEYPYPFDAVPGDRLNIIMVPEGDVLMRCNDMGGELIGDLERDLWTCEGVDF